MDFFSRDTRARNTHVEATLNLSCPAQEGQEAEYDAVAALVADPKFRGKVTIHDARVSHEDMMRAMATASGLVHYSNQDRNPRVLYEALTSDCPCSSRRRPCPTWACSASPS